MATIQFTHSQVGSLVIENGIDEATWGYNLNTQSFPTYGGEVVQVLSVYIDDLNLGGSCSTYDQIEAIYSYFAAYMQKATQGLNGPTHPGVTSYNQEAMIFTYPERGWNFSIYPKAAPGFGYGWDVVLGTWRLNAHINDTANEGGSLEEIKAAIKDSFVADQMSDFKSLNDEISPDTTRANPENNPFQTFDQGAQQATAAIKSYTDYYSSLIPAYQQGDFQSLTGGLGANPVGPNSGGGQVDVPPKHPKKT